MANYSPTYETVVVSAYLHVGSGKVVCVTSASVNGTRRPPPQPGDLPTAALRHTVHRLWPHLLERVRRLFVELPSPETTFWKTEGEGARLEPPRLVDNCDFEVRVEGQAEAKVSNAEELADFCMERCLFTDEDGAQELNLTFTPCR